MVRPGPRASGSSRGRQWLKPPYGNRQGGETFRRRELKSRRPARIVDLEIDKSRPYSGLELSCPVPSGIVEVRFGSRIIHTECNDAGIIRYRSFSCTKNMPG